MGSVFAGTGVLGFNAIGLRPDVNEAASSADLLQLPTLESVL